MTKKKKGFPIRLKLFLALIISLLLAAGVFYAVSRLGSFLVWRYYLGENDKKERAEEYVEKFQQYVTDNNLTTNDADMISAWDAGKYVDFIVYKDSNLIYAPAWFEVIKESEAEAEAKTEDSSKPKDEEDALVPEDNGGEENDSKEAEGEAPKPGDENEGEDTLVETDPGKVGEYASEIESMSSSEETSDETGSDETEETETEDEKSFYEQWFLGDKGFEQYLTEEARKSYITVLNEALADEDSLYPVYFSDGTLIVAVADFSEEFFSNIVLAVSILSGLLVIAVIMICYFGTITKRITLLQKNVRKIEEGDLELRVAQKGRDEIALLARDIESMRDSIVDNMTREKRAWEANAGLITAMSHDIRTPLTVLLGYLDLIEMQNDGKISEEYIASCRENALRLKNLSDDMFSYFLVFGKSEEKIALSRVDARMLMEHVVSEYALLLSETGYTLEPRGEVPGISLEIEEMYFRRVMDNIFSNIIKYADPSSPIVLGVDCSDEKLTFYCENKIRMGEDRPESNGIGLRTCERMMEEMGGRMTFGENGENFKIAITLPASKN